VDADGDGMNSYAEYRARTDPTRADSVLSLRGPAPDPAGVCVRWQTSEGRLYAIDRAGDLCQGFTRIQANLPPTPTTNTFVDTNATGSAQAFYRISVVAPH
jgi:hypothetical protein